MTIGLLLDPLVSCTMWGCEKGNTASTNVPSIAPRAVTEAVRHDADDPAIWLTPTDPKETLILGTDKDADGALYVFRLDGRVVPEKVVHGLNRPNNVDVAYGLLLSLALPSRG
jgi:3-phytase